MRYAIFWTIAATALAQQPTVSLPPDLERVLRDYETAWRAKDAAALSRLFAEDGYVMTDGAAVVKGRAAIERAYRGAGGPLFLRAIAYAAEGNTGFILGEFKHREDAAKDSGKFTLTLKRSSGGPWLIYSDMDNPNQPPPRR